MWTANPRKTWRFNKEHLLNGYRQVRLEIVASKKIRLFQGYEGWKIQAGDHVTGLK